MHGTAPLVRSIAKAAAHQPSKIPHLRFHIVLRQSRPHQVRHDTCKVPYRQQRQQSTTASTTYLDKSYDNAAPNDEAFSLRNAEPVVEEEEIQRPVAMHNTGTVRVNGGMNMFDILEEGLPDKILSGLLSHSIGSPFIRQADNEIFNQALLALKPEYFIEPFKSLSRHYKNLNRKDKQNILEVKHFDQRSSTFAAYLDWIIALRRESGKSLDLEACNHLLKCAASMGDGQLAKAVMTTIIPNDGVDPTLKSYNYYCEALLWSHAFSSSENYNLRVIPRHLDFRSSKSPPKSLSGHVTSGTPLQPLGIRDQILDLFKQCMSKGFSANEYTFVNLITAMGREGDLEGVQSVLKSVWNIDVDMLGTYDEEEIQSPTFYEEDHHLRPSERLLSALAHVYGINNDIRTAWLLVDFVSRNYNTPITKNVWSHLCEWAFVLCLRRDKAARKQGRDIGQVSQETFVQMVEAMMDEPHSIESDALIQYLLSRSWRNKKHLDKSIIHLRELERHFHQQQVKTEKVAKEVMHFARESARSEQADSFATDAFYSLRRRYMMEFFEFQRTFQFIKSAVYNVVLETTWPGSRKLNEWERRKLPDLIDEFGEYLPHRVIYKTQTGRVELNTAFVQRQRYHQKFTLDYRALPRILNAMDTDDPVKLVRRMSVLNDVIINRQKYCFNCESTEHAHSECKRNPPDDSKFRLQNKVNKTEEKLNEEELLVFNPRISKEAVPFSLEPGAERELANPTLPFP